MAETESIVQEAMHVPGTGADSACVFLHPVINHNSVQLDESRGLKITPGPFIAENWT